MSGDTFKATVRYGTHFYGSLFDEDELERLETHDDPPLITFAYDRIIVAFDRSDHVYEFPIERVIPATDEATWGRQFSHWLARHPRPMKSL